MDYDSLLDRSLRLTLAEAASGWLDAQLEKQLKDAQRDGKPVPATPVKIVKPAAGYASCPQLVQSFKDVIILKGKMDWGRNSQDLCPHTTSL